MELLNRLIKLTLIATVLLIWGCWRDDDTNAKKTADGKTSLFGEVTNPEITLSNTGDGAYEYAASDGSGRTTGAGSPTMLVTSATPSFNIQLSDASS